MQYYFLEQKQTCLNQDLVERLKWRGIAVKQVDNKRKREQERKGEAEEGKEGKEPKKQGKESRVSDELKVQNKRSKAYF